MKQKLEDGRWLIQLPADRRVSLHGIGRHKRYRVETQSDWTLILHPADDERRD